MREDTNDAAATAVATYYTAAPTAGAISGGPYISERCISASASAMGGHRIDWTFGDKPGARAFVLRGTGDYFTVSLGTIAGTAPVADFWAEWTEE
jgi:hypothetical protein